MTQDAQPSYRLANSTSDSDNSFEFSLNSVYTDKTEKFTLPYIIEIPCTFINGKVSTTEQNRIIQEIVSIDYKGKQPYVIDVNPRDSRVEVIFNSPRLGGEPTEWDDPCHGDDWDDIFDCEDDVFNGQGDLRPDGGINVNGEQLPGTACDPDGTNEVPIGGLGLIAETLNQNIPLPDNFLHFDNIGTVFQYGGSVNEIDTSIWDTSDHAMFVTDTSLFWREYDGNGTWESPHPLCFTNEDLNNYYCTIADVMQKTLPDGYVVIGILSAKLSIIHDESGAAWVYWDIIYNVGIPVLCCDCCC